MSAEQALQWRRMIEPGLCGDCVHAQTIHSDRGSTFYLCRLGLTNPRFPKYPRLPVRECDGYQRQASNRPNSEADAKHEE